MTFRKVFVTGATGFIGSNLVRQLKASSFAEEIFGLSRSERGDKMIAELGATPVRNDLEKGSGAEIPRGIDVVFHLAGKLAGSLDDLLKVNEQGTAFLLRALLNDNQCPVFVGLSSIAAAGPGKKSGNRSEADPPVPISNYGRSKLAGERVTQSFADRIPVSLIRPGIVYGPGDKEFLRLMQAMNRLHLNPMVGKGDAPLSFVEVSDLVRLIMLVAIAGERVADLTPCGDSRAGGGVYNAAADDFLTLREVGRLFSETTGRAVLPIPFPRSIGYCLGYAGEWVSALFHKPSTLTRDKIREACAESWRVDSSKAVKQLGWQPTPTKESLAQWIVQAQKLHLL